jgi:hypothetical protein
MMVLLKVKGSCNGYSQVGYIRIETKRDATLLETLEKINKQGIVKYSILDIIKIV